MGISFKTTYDEKGNPQRVNMSGRSFESGKTYEPNPNDTSRVIDSETGADVPTNEERRQQFSGILNYLEDANISNVTPDNITQLKNELKGFPITTTDPNEQRNAFQLFVNSMLGNDRGAKPIDTRNFTGLFDGADNFFDLRRTGPSTFINPDVEPSLTGDIFSLLTGRENPRVFNLNDIPDGGGIANIDYGQEGKDKAAELGIKDYGALFEGLFKAFTPAKYLDFVLNPAKDALDTGKDLTSDVLEKATKPIDSIAEYIESLRKKFKGEETSFLNNKDGSFDVAELNKTQKNIINNRNRQFQIQEGGITPEQLFKMLQEYDKPKGFFSKGNKVDFEEDILPLFQPGANTLV